MGLSEMTVLPVESAFFMKNVRQSPVFITVQNEKTKSRWHLYAPDKVWKNLGEFVNGLFSPLLLEPCNFCDYGIVDGLVELVDKNGIIVKHGKSWN